MKRLYFLFAFVAMLLGFAGCDSECGNEVYVPFKVKEGDRWGMLSTENGKILFENKFENEPSHTVNGLFIVKEGDSYSLYKAGSSPKLLRSGLFQVLHKENGSKYLVASIEGESLFFMDEEGNTVKEVKDVVGKDVESIIVHKGGFFEAGGKLISPDMAVVANFGEDNVWYGGDYGYYLISVNGLPYAGCSNSQPIDLKNLNPKISFYKSTKIKSATITTFDGEKEGFFNFAGLDGKEFEINYVPKDVNYIADFASKWYIYHGKKGDGVRDMNHNQIVPEKYHYIIYDNDCFLAKQNKDYQYDIIDMQGNVTGSFVNENELVRSVGGAYISEENKQCTLVDKNGKKISDSYFSISQGEWTASEYYDEDGGRDQVSKVWMEIY